MASLAKLIPELPTQISWYLNDSELLNFPLCNTKCHQASHNGLKHDHPLMEKHGLIHLRAQPVGSLNTSVTRNLRELILAIYTTKMIVDHIRIWHLPEDCPGESHRDTECQLLSQLAKKTLVPLDDPFGESRFNWTLFPRTCSKFSINFSHVSTSPKRKAPSIMMRVHTVKTANNTITLGESIAHDIGRGTTSARLGSCGYSCSCDRLGLAQAQSFASIHPKLNIR